MVSSFNNRVVLTLGFAEAFLMAAASPMTDHVLPPLIRVGSYAVAVGVAAVMHLAIQLGAVHKTDGSAVTTDLLPVAPNEVPQL